MTEERKMAIASRLRVARERAGLSQAQVAKILNLHRPSVSEMEAGRRSVTAQELTELARIYGVSVQWLIEEAVDPAKDKLQLAARELSKLKPRDVDTLLQLLSSLRDRSEER